MLKNIILNNIWQNILSLRLQILFIIVMIVFILGSLAYIFQYKAAIHEYEIYGNKLKNNPSQGGDPFLGISGLNATSAAVEMRNYIFRPVQNEFIEDAQSRYIPNTITFNAFNVFSYSISQRSGNPYLNLSQELNWSFIVTILLSFAILLISFDSISGERESHTLSLIISNSVPRIVLLTGKYVSIVISGILLTLPGFIVSILILILSGIVRVDAMFFFETVFFIVAQLLIIACMAVLGMFCSVVSRTSNVSLLTSLTLWCVFLIFSPNLAVFSAEHIFDIKNSETIHQEIESAKDLINKAAPEGSWSMNGQDQFYPNHRLRAKNQTNLMNAEKTINDAWYNDQFRQYQQASLFSYISPVSLFEMVGESITANGYFRFRKNWNDIHNFQGQFLVWFKEIDLKDKTSPHWYNPYEDCSTSRAKIKFEDIPQYSETDSSIVQRLTAAFPGTIALILYAAVLFAVTVVIFNRYDVR
jgi:ABC-type transport system involved in multi-copper enzyme maturation permease subunit